MSAYLDSLSGSGYDGSETGGIGSVGTTMAGERPFSESAFAQFGASTLFGYLNRRLDIDLQRRVYGGMPTPEQRGSAPVIGYGGRGVPMPAQPGAQAQEMSSQTVLMLAAAAVGAFFLAAG